VGRFIYFRGMESFIREVLLNLQKSSHNLSDIVFILPSKRAGSYLLKELSAISEVNVFAPTVLSIEEFTEEISGLQSIDNTISLFEFYEAYKNQTSKEEREDFETFISWAQSLIHDFNEIDRYLIDYRSFFNYLSGIQDINHWYLQDEKTELIKRYLAFWKKLPDYYEGLRDQLLAKEQGYQGLIYRKAAENIENYTRQNQSHHVFIGFNALNASEQLILQHLLESGKSHVFWDIDETFYKDRSHGASMFLRKYLNDWKYYQKYPYKEFTNQFSEEKNIKLIGVPKNIGQAKYLGEILSDLDMEQLENTAVVLGEEELLLPVLNSLPSSIKDLNITMGFPVKNAPVNSLFEALFQLHMAKTESFYFKEVIQIAHHPSLQSILKEHSENLIAQIHSENLVYLDYKRILGMFPEEFHGLIKSLFKSKKDSIDEFIESLHEIIQQLKSQLHEEEDKLGLEFLYHFHILFNKLENLNNQYPHLKTIKALHGFYKELVSTQSLDFQGRPFKGLQLMGMLESRALDFETVIITSLNEGVLPAGKSDNSFIPYDLKQQYQLPTYKEKDAVYTYHFYRLLQRAKNVYLLYNTEAEGLNSGEKSRFITQLEVENQNSHTLENILVNPKVPVLGAELKEIKKTPEIMARIRSLASSGFSPSALTTYIRNPLDFYIQYVLGIKDQDEVEETVAFNTLGTVVHNSLESLYKPYEGKIITEEIILNFLSQVEVQIATEFSNSYSKTPLDKGKNLLIYEVAKRYLQNFLKFELQRVKAGQEIKIEQIETDLNIPFEIKNIDFPVNLRGKVDRYELLNGMPTIIDYKTGRVENYHLNVTEWEEITKDYEKYSKSFQVLTYTSLLSLEKHLKFPAEAGILSFKNLKSGFLKFEKKENGSRNKDSLITEETLSLFQAELKKLIVEICNPEVPFIEKEVKKNHGSF